MSHEVFDACLGELGGRLPSVVVHALVGDTFLAHARLEAGDRLLVVDSRPSDGLILAVRRQAPIFVMPAVIEQVGRPLQDLAQVLEEVASRVQEA